MKIVWIALAVASVSAPALAQSSYSTRGYVRSDGTYVQPHRSTNPDSSTYNNWSSKPNVNPYTGQAGTRNPTPSYGSTYRTPGLYSNTQQRRSCGYYGC